MQIMFAAPLVLALAAPASAASHPFSVHDMLAMDRISDPRVSPDGTRVVFTVRVTDLEANKGRTDLWIANVDGTGVRRLTTHEASDSSGRFAPDGRSVYFLSTRGGSSQVYRLGLDGGEPEAVTSLPLDVDALEVAPGGKHLLFSLAVLPGKSPEETAKAQADKQKAKASGLVYDRLFFRHWDSWGDGTRNHLFSFDLASGRAADLMGSMDADAPSKPFGGSEEFTVSPDGKTVVFSARAVGRDEAWSTNFDLYSVPVEGLVAPKKITSNPAWDTQPRFSPDGKTLAWLAMARPGFEADRLDIVTRDLASATERKFVVRVGEGADNDRSVSRDDLDAGREGAPPHGRSPRSASRPRLRSRNRQDPCRRGRGHGRQPAGGCRRSDSLHAPHAPRPHRDRHRGGRRLRWMQTPGASRA